MRSVFLELMNRLLSLVLVLGVATFSAYAADTLEKRNLKPEWQVHTGSEFKPFNQQQDGAARAVYFFVDAQLFRGDYLKVESSEPFSLFINNQLAAETKKSILISIDSMSVLFGPLNFAVYTSNINNLKTTVVSLVNFREATEEPLTQRPSSAFRDFVIVAVLLVVVFFLILVRLNPRVAMDYFSVTRIISLRESEDVQTYTKIISVSILFYVFVALLLGLFLSFISHLTGPLYSFTWDTTESSFLLIMFHWLRASVMILLIILAKLIIIHTLASLFGLGEVAAFHFFNFVRMILILAVLVAVISCGYYLTQGHGQAVYLFLFAALRVVVLGWIAFLFFKLAYRVSASKFHLFSYLCATEILPLLIIAKVLYE